jgi:hypothetical protein
MGAALKLIAMRRSRRWVESGVVPAHARDILTCRTSLTSLETTFAMVQRIFGESTLLARWAGISFIRKSGADAHIVRREDAELTLFARATQRSYPSSSENNPPLEHVLGLGTFPHAKADLSSTHTKEIRDEDHLCWTHTGRGPDNGRWQRTLCRLGRQAPQLRLCWRAPSQ